MNTSVTKLQITKKQSPKGINSKEESFLTNFATFVDSATNTFWLMIRTHFKGSTFYLANIFIPILITIGALAFMTATTGISFILFLSLTFAGLSTYGTIFFSIRKSTIIKNIQMTSNETGVLYYATFWTIFTSIFITLGVVLLSIFILDEVGFVAHHMSYVNPDNVELMEASTWYTDYSNIWWGMLIYNGIMQTFLCFSLAFFFEKIASTQRNYFLIVMIYVLLGIFFSGVFSSTLYITEDGQVAAITEEILNSDQSLELLQGISVIDAYVWGNPMWMAGQFFPHFGSNALVYNSFAGGAYHYIDGELIYNRWNEISLFNSVTSARAIYYILVPWVWVILLVYIASMMERFKEKGSK